MTAPDQIERDAAALAIALDQGFLKEDEADEISMGYDYRRYDAGPAELLVLTDEEADRLVIEDVRESLWAFNADFLSAYMPDGIDADQITAIRGDRCEGANEAMLALVNAGPYTVEELAEEAATADGRGHFLASYDGEEIEHEHDGRLWYAYRTN
jgi:hypothetical protein